MLDLRLEYLGEGRFRARTKLDYDLCCEQLGQGEKLRAQITKPRSVRQNNLFHALIAAAYENQRGGPRLPSWQHLKSWLLIQVGWCDVKEFDAGAITPEVAAALRQAFDTVDFTTDGEKIYMRVARSVRFGRGGADADEMQDVMDRVVAMICTDIVPGTNPAELMDEARERVA